MRVGDKALQAMEEAPPPGGLGFRPRTRTRLRLRAIRRPHPTIVTTRTLRWGLRQLHLPAAWTSHNTPAFDFAAAHSN